MPEHQYESINGAPAWDRQVVMDWAATTGRLPEDLWGEVDPSILKKPPESK